MYYIPYWGKQGESQKHEKTLEGLDIELEQKPHLKIPIIIIIIVSFFPQLPTGMSSDKIKFSKGLLKLLFQCTILPEWDLCFKKV